ncbi:hypothetical protein [Neobacillus sp.]|uniref:hypothetical protein n=1 Tax=Neobacillus sp. TaxID=2675273 RepID=UPI0028A255A5|nr:hypothetical protein [Neobacillus sp.]
MKKLFAHTETIDFKTFCEGGSPEYVAAKQKLKKAYQQQQQHNSLKSQSLANSRNHTAQSKFGLGSERQSKSQTFGDLKNNNYRRNLTAYSLFINPLALFDVHFMLAAGAVLLVALIEKKLAENGIINIAAVLSGALQIGFPLVALGSIIILISKLGVFL